MYLKRYINILSIILVISIATYYIRSWETFYSNPKIQVVIYETDLENENLKSLKDTLQKNAYDFKILTDKTWNGFGGKIQKIAKYLRSIDPHRVVLVCDARDVLCVNHRSDILLEKFNDEIKSPKVVVSTEIGCCVRTNFKPGEYRTSNGKVLRRTFLTSDQNEDKQWKKMFKLRADNHRVKHEIPSKQSIYLNAGIYIGRAKDLLRIYDLMNIGAKEDDQLIMSETFYHHPHRFHLDYNREYFSNSHVWDTLNKKDISSDSGCYYELKNKKIQDTYMNSEPFFIHTPGKHFKCFKAVQKMINGIN